MAETFSERHHAECKKCGYVEPDSCYGHDKFINRFFLPSICGGCGEYPDWQHIKRKMKLIKNKPSWNPLKWGGRWHEVERKTADARR